MHNFRVNNATERAEIDIFGEIGESWFSEGYTMERCRADLKGIKAKAITLNISSLGGDVNDALVIYDLLKSHNATITARIMGATASAGTVVAMGADSVEMSENSLFLVHNAWTIALGNADQLRGTASDLDKFDDRLVGIYTRKTGKDDTEIRTLMAEEKWIDASEAQEYGFVDAIYIPTKAAASAIKVQIEQIKADGRLPDLPQNTNIKPDEMTEETKTWIAEQFDSIRNLFKPKDDQPVAVTVSGEQVEQMIADIEQRVNDAQVTHDEDLATRVAEMEQGLSSRRINGI